MGGSETKGKDVKAIKAKLEKALPLFPFFPTSDYPAPIMPHLFLGSYEHATNEQILVAMKFTHVVNCVEGDCDTAHYETLYKKLGIQWYGFSSQDDKGYDMLSNHYERVKGYLDCVERLEGRCLLHCQAGVNRSGVLAIAYVTEKTKCTLFEAAAEVRKQRGRVCTNTAFQAQLIKMAIRENWEIGEPEGDFGEVDEDGAAAEKQK